MNSWWRCWWWCWWRGWWGDADCERILMMPLSLSDPSTFRSREHYTKHKRKAQKKKRKKKKEKKKRKKTHTGTLHILHNGLWSNTIQTDLTRFAVKQYTLPPSPVPLAISTFLRNVVTFLKIRNKKVVRCVILLTVVLFWHQPQGETRVGTYTSSISILVYWLMVEDLPTDQPSWILTHLTYISIC